MVISHIKLPRDTGLIFTLASVINVPSNSCLPRLAFCSFCLGSFGANSGSLRQQINAQKRHSSTIRSPARKVNILDNRKHHHFRTWRQLSSKGASVVTNSSSQPDIPYRREFIAGIFSYFMSFTFINHLTLSIIFWINFCSFSYSFCIIAAVSCCCH